MKRVKYMNFCSNCRSQFITDKRTSCEYCGEEVRTFPFIICGCGTRVYLQNENNSCWECHKVYNTKGKEVAVR